MLFIFPHVVIAAFAKYSLRYCCQTSRSAKGKHEIATILRHEFRVNSMKAGTILVVEDDESLRRVMQMQLEKAGHKTTVAEDVPQALEILQQERQDVVITELKPSRRIRIGPAEENSH